MTEFKGKNGEGIRSSRATAGMLQTGRWWLTCREKNMSGLGPFSFLLPWEIPYSKSSFPIGNFFPGGT